MKSSAKSNDNKQNSMRINENLRHFMKSKDNK